MQYVVAITWRKESSFSMTMNVVSADNEDDALTMGEALGAKKIIKDLGEGYERLIGLSNPVHLTSY